MTFDRKTLVIPDETRFEENKITTKGDVVIGDRSMLQFNVKTNGRIFVGEHVITSGGLEATKDIRADIFSNIGGNVKSGGNVYLGEKVKVKGKLTLKGDLDVGDSVEIESGFEAKGWINIRSPVPVVIYVFIYLLQLLKMGHSEEIERILEELEQNDGETIPISETFLFIPTNSILGVSKSQVDSNLQIGNKCKIVGNYDIKGNVFVDENTEIFGSLKSTEDIFCNKNVKIHGNIDTKGNINLSENVNVLGNVSGDKILISKTSSVQGTINAKNGIKFYDSSKENADKTLKRFQTGTDVVDEVKEMLE